MIIVTQFRLPTDCWPPLYQFLAEVDAHDPAVLAHLWDAVPQPRRHAPDAASVAATRMILRRGRPADAVALTIWRWAEDHRLVRPLPCLHDRRPWESLECYYLWNYSRSLVGMALTLLTLGEELPPFPDLAGSPMRHDPFEIEEYLSLARTAAHMTEADCDLIAEAMHNPMRPTNEATGKALVLAGVMPVGDECSFAALAQYQVGVRSADRIGCDLGIDRQVADRWIRGAAAQLVGRVSVTGWLRDHAPAGRPRKDAGTPGT